MDVDDTLPQRAPAQRLEQIFDAALEIPSTQLPAFLDHACAGDAELRREVERLLEANREPTAGVLRVLDAAAPAVAGIPTGESMSVQALRNEEVARLRIFLRVVIATLVASSATLLLVGGDPLVKGILLGGILGILALTLWMLHLFRDERTYSTRLMVVFVCFGVIASYPSVYFWGLFSPIIALYTLCLSFLGLSTSRRVALAAYVCCCGAHLTLAALLFGGLIADRSLIPVTALPWSEAIGTQVMTHGLYLAAFVTARANRRTGDEAAAKLERAVRDVARREALLQEARQELAEMRRQGAPGSLSGQEVGSYRLGVLLGQGGMGEVYEAAHLATGEPAAMKLLHRHVAADHQHVERFLREARIASQLDSAHVGAVREIGRTAGELPYLVNGAPARLDLAELLRQRKRLPMAEVVDLLEQVGAGLATARRAGIVHRDIKPQNLFATEQPAGRTLWKILDFGIARLGTSKGTLTAGHLVGTPGYMAPEQVQHEDIDHRTDLFALAAVAYRALTGQPAFVGSSLPQMLYRVVYGMPEPPSAHVDVPEDVNLVLLIGLAKRKEDRFDSGAAMAEALLAASRGELDDELRARARALLCTQPWDTLSTRK